MPPNGGAHFALHVEDLDAAVDALRAKGIKVDPVPEMPGAGRQAFLTDPAGNLIELNQPTGPVPRRAVSEPSRTAGCPTTPPGDTVLRDYVDSAAHYFVDVGRAVGARRSSTTTTSRARTTARRSRSPTWASSADRSTATSGATCSRDP